MNVGDIIQIVIFVVLALTIVIIVLAALKAVPKPRKGKSYRFSKNGDDWIQKYKEVRR